MQLHQSRSGLRSGFPVNVVGPELLELEVSNRSLRLRSEDVIYGDSANAPDS